MGNLLNYSAIAAKVRAMRSRLFSAEDFRKLAMQESVPAAVEVLRGYPAYEKIFEGAESGNLHREQIEQLLWLSLYRDFSGLYRFASVRQRKFLDLYFMHFEVELLKHCLRNVASGRSSPPEVHLYENFFRHHSRLDFISLAECTSIGDFVERLSGSVYAKPMQELTAAGGIALADYVSALDTLYFTEVWKHVIKHLGREEQEAVMECIGEKIDLLNLEWIARAKQYYQLNGRAIRELLIPVYYRLRKKQVHDLSEAESFDSFLDSLRTTRYGDRVFGKEGEKQETTGLKQLFRSLLNTVYESSRKKNPYSAAILNSYLHFKEEEIRKLITIIEGIRYSLDREEILACLGEC